MTVNPSILRNIVDGFDHKRVLLVGDPILDIYVYGKAMGISSETPTIVASETRTEVSFGGSSLVARNLLELGARVSYVAVLGDDTESRLYEHFAHEKLMKRFVIDGSRRTTVKKRFWIDGYKLLQLDQLDNRDVDGQIAEEVINIVQGEIGNKDVVIISDNQHGMMTGELIDAMRSLCLKYNKNAFVDSQASQRRTNVEKYRDFYFICMNKNEAAQLDKQFVETESFERLKDKLGSSNICVKLGEKGSIAIVGRSVIRTPGIKVNAVDTCGAGDSFLSALSIGEPLLPAESLLVANTWAGLSITKHGINPPQKQELIDYLSRLDSPVALNARGSTTSVPSPSMGEG